MFVQVQWTGNCMHFRDASVAAGSTDVLRWGGHASRYGVGGVRSETPWFRQWSNRTERILNKVKSRFGYLRTESSCFFIYLSAMTPFFEHLYGVAIHLLLISKKFSSIENAISWLLTIFFYIFYTRTTYITIINILLTIDYWLINENK